MPKKLKAWPRPHFTPGGGNPLLFFVVFGNFDLSPPLSSGKYRSNGPGDWLSVFHLIEPEKIGQYRSGLIWEKLTRDSPVTAEEALRAPQAVVVRGDVTDPETLDYFRDAIGVITHLLDCGGLSIYDPQRFWLWSGGEWRTDVFEPNEPQPQEHTVILISDEEDGAQWFHTRGMRQYGRPDLSVHGVGPKHMDAVTLMIDRFIELQAYGGLIPEGQAIRMAGLPAGGVCRHRGDLDDPDFNNVHVEIEWPERALRE